MTIRERLAGVADLWRTPMSVPPTPLTKRQLNTETVLVLLLSLGASAIYSLLSIIRRLVVAAQTHTSLNQQSSSLNTSQAQQQWLDFIYQVVGIALALVPAILVIHLLGREMTSATRYLGFDLTRPKVDLSLGALLAACVGIPGLALYVIARDLGFNTTVVASGLGDTWWSWPVLIASAAQNAIVEEVIMLGYLFTRWTQAGWRLPAVLLTSAVVRGSYHLYQGFGGFLGNLIMGLIFGLVYLRVRRVLPMVVAHTILDTVAFVGYALLHNNVGWL